MNLDGKLDIDNDKEIPDYIKIRFLELQLLKGKFDNLIFSDFEYDTTDYLVYKVASNIILTEDNLDSFHLLGKSKNEYRLSLLPNNDTNFGLSQGLVDVAKKYLGEKSYNNYDRYFYYLLHLVKDYWDYIPIEKFEYYRRKIKVGTFNFKNYLITRENGN